MVVHFAEVRLIGLIRVVDYVIRLIYPYICLRIRTPPYTLTVSIIHNLHYTLACRQ